MARIRSIHPEACTSERLARVSGDAERCYWRLQTHCDDAGRAEDNVRLIWAALFPLHETVGPHDVDEWLNELAKEELVERYEVDGKHYLAILQWGRFQHPQRPKDSNIPASSRTCNGSVADGARIGHGDVLPGEGEGDAHNNARTQRATRIPNEFRVTPEMVRWVERECPGLDWAHHTKRFVNHWKSTGKNAAKMDWLRTWQNWMLKEFKP